MKSAAEVVKEIAALPRHNGLWLEDTKAIIESFAQEVRSDERRNLVIAASPDLKEIISEQRADMVTVAERDAAVKEKVLEVRREIEERRRNLPPMEDRTDYGKGVDAGLSDALSVTSLALPKPPVSAWALRAAKRLYELRISANRPEVTFEQEAEIIQAAYNEEEQRAKE